MACTVVVIGRQGNIRTTIASLIEGYLRTRYLFLLIIGFKQYNILVLFQGA